VHAEAEILEHHLSDRVADAIDHHLGHPHFDPHGEPIPRSNGTIDDLAGQPLSEMEEASDFRIVRVVPESEKLLVYLESLDIGIGSCGSIVSKTPMNGPITLRINTRDRVAEHALGRHITDLLYAEPKKR
jgi:DtxR family Mn-dependent transcriptional regulator